MTLQQTMAFALVGVTLLLFIWGRFRYDVIALASLLKPNARVVALSSAGHRYSDVDLEDPGFERTPYEPFAAYGRSKSTNVEGHRTTGHLGTLWCARVTSRPGLATEGARAGGLVTKPHHPPQDRAG